MSSTYNHPQPVDLGGNVQTDASATTIKPVEGAPQDATHAPMTVIVDPNAKPEKMSFKEQMRGYAKIYAGKAFGNMDEVALGKAQLADQLPDRKL
ncbi:hypothetical protein FFLO_01661 [Filobasidium floriforme]|uniref:Uncharacterized protein n=1 Tax=Filobasidium floriforme TaxID=5210 RepID=A0A8K0NUM3_9TREE|nr:uncharacterized protein HD553DRAFT_309749 [Filobasidium floriforme]KAG7562832.1 hypothetical protein FFLO_01661 [Filobasidium floriforme]KAH8086482.1 hypothetical protein HD553DRAFT_309749 [Filobasidium floriforme]